MNYDLQCETIRELGRKVREIADSVENEASKRRWRDVNALRKPDRAPVYCRPIAAWEELLPEDSLVCADSRLRALEILFRQALIKEEIGDDSIVLPYIPVEAVFHADPPDEFGIQIRRHESAAPGGAWSYMPSLRGNADFDRLVIPRYTYDKAKTEESAEFINELLHDILPPKIGFTPKEHMSLCTAAADLRGLTEMMIDAAESPELLHRLMAYLRDREMSILDQMQATGLLTPNTNDVMYMSDELNPTPGEPVTYKNCFGVGDSQEFDQISPAMWEEFLLAYQKPLFARFGLSAYGCCENLSRKIDGVLSIPNLRVFVCSAWTDLDKVIEKTQGRYTVMWRQKASDVVFSDMFFIKNHLNEGCSRLRGGYYQIVLRELQTLNGDMNRLHAWTRLAIESAEKYA